MEFIKVDYIIPLGIKNFSSLCLTLYPYGLRIYMSEKRKDFI